MVIKDTILKNQRVGVFVDVQNLYYSARHLYKRKVDFGNVLKEAVRGRQLIRAIAYVVKADKDDEQKSHENSTAIPGSERSFFEALSAIGYEVKSKDLLVYGGGFKKGDWDVGISMDAIELAPRLDTVVLVSGDGDFLPLIEHLRRAMGCRVEVLAFGRSASRQVKDGADQFIDMDASRNFLIKKAV